MAQVASSRPVSSPHFQQCRHARSTQLGHSVAAYSAESFERFSTRLSEEDAGAAAERDRLRQSAEEACRLLRNVDAEEESLRRLAALRDSLAADARAAQENGDLVALRAISRALADEVHFAYTTSGHLTIAGISPGDRLCFPVYDPNDENAIGYRLEREHALPLAAGIKVSGSGVPE